MEVVGIVEWVQVSDPGNALGAVCVAGPGMGCSSVTRQKEVPLVNYSFRKQTESEATSQETKNKLLYSLFS